MMRKKREKGIVRILCAMLILMLPQVMGQAEEPEVIRIGYQPNDNVVSDIDNLHAKGYGYEIFEKIEESSNFEFEYVAMKDISYEEALRSGLVDVVGFYFKTPERAEEFLFSDTWYGKAHISLTTREKHIFYNDPETMNGKTVSTYEGSFGNEILEEYCRQNGIAMNFQYSSNSEYMYVEADYYLAYGDAQIPVGHQTALNLGVYNLFLLSNYGNEELMEKLDTKLLEVVATEGNFFLELEEKYYGGDIDTNHRTLTKGETALLQQRTLQVGYSEDYNPISFTNDSGKADGSMVETLNFLADLYDFDIEYHPYSIHDDPKEREKYDLLVTFYGDVETELETYEKVEPYYEVAMFGQVPKETYEQSESIREIIENSPRIGILHYLAFDYEQFALQFPENELMVYEDWNQMLDEYASGKVDMIICTESASTYMEAYLKEVDKVAFSIDMNFPMQFLISKEISDEYKSIFNVMQDNVSMTTYKGMLLNNSNEFYPSATFLSVLKENWHYFISVIVLALLGFFWYAYLQQLKKKEILYEAYNVDSLTGVMTSPNFASSVIEMLKTAQPNEYEMISLDIDLFKTINSYFSLDRGTEMIKALGKALQEGLAGSSAIIMRRTADQFIIFRKVDDGGTIQSIYKEKILPELRKIIGKKYNLSLSFGYYTVDDCNEKMSEIVGYADSARGQGKSVHKTTFIEFDQKMKKDYDNRLNVTFRMEQAIRDREFSVVYQPKIDFKTLQVGGAEALVRWFPRLGDVIYPDAFIPVFENNGFIAELDMYVLEEVCKFIRSNYRVLKIPRISVNLSAWTVLEPYITTRITAITENYGIPNRDIELEITESAIIGEETNFLNKVSELKKLGFVISIDDFGAGVSSLNRLSAIDADILKLDKAFFDLKDQGGKSTIVVEDVIKMAKHLDMQIVAEGVENYGQALWLKKLECEYAQGYYFEKPMDEEKFKELLESKKIYTIS